MHRHIDLYKEIVWELHRIEREDGERQRQRQLEREQGRRKQGGASEQQQQQRHEVEANQRTEDSRDRAQLKGKVDAQQSGAWKSSS